MGSKPCTDSVLYLCQCHICDRKKNSGDCCTIWDNLKPCQRPNDIKPVEDCILFIEHNNRTNLVR